MISVQVKKQNRKIYNTKKYQYLIIQQIICENLSLNELSDRQRV